MEQNVHKHVHLMFIVEDNGTRYERGVRQTIFPALYREQTASTKEIQGTGLGMAITKNIVDLMGGTINVKVNSAREASSASNSNLLLPTKWTTTSSGKTQT